MASDSHQRHPVPFIKVFPSRSGKPPTSTQLDSLPMMVHIWYDIRLCTILPEKSNGDVFRTKLYHSNPSPQIHHPFQRKNSQPCSPAIPGGYQQIIQGLPPPGSAGGGLLFSLQNQSRGNSKRLRIIKSAGKVSSTSAFLGQLNWAIQAVFKQLAWPWPFWANSYSTVGVQSHISIFKMARAVLAQFGQYSLVTYLLSACDSKPEHKHDSQNTMNQWYSQDTTKTWS
ncbi:hypothetical protein O181_073359 [Austropuccinia psidii MF-1]|uniref:Uncharacterized protein n=1 Tax=Austropuccinia psidii MF-1 TaxID=1389203 RepID=A0A9Q3F6Y1_9BASI|nr:hypothetical protein [Austropuccinia psidii MF-1]